MWKVALVFVNVFQGFETFVHRTRFRNTNKRLWTHLWTNTPSIIPKNVKSKKKKLVAVGSTWFPL